jgi:hypothetical protein
MTVKVIGAGFGRTGTTSLAAALERLGFVKCHHMKEIVRDHGQAAAWMAAYRGEPVDWHTLLADYQATTDWPSCHFYRELMSEYPDAKVVLTIRDPERWYDSVRETIFPLSAEAPRWFCRFIPRIHALLTLTDHNIWNGEFGGRFRDRAHAIAVFNAHIEEVERTVPPERLLVYSVKQGWGPLCEFLDVPVPDEPFPHLNERAMLQGVLRRLEIMSVLIPTLLVLLLLLLLALLLVFALGDAHALA